MRLPKDVNNWTLAHAIAAVKAARVGLSTSTNGCTAPITSSGRTNFMASIWTAEETARQVITADEQHQPDG